MPRNARLKLADGGSYHLCARAAARHGEFPLAVPLVRFKFFELLISRNGFTSVAPS